MGIGDIIYRSVRTKVESIIIDLSTQTWTLGRVEATGTNPSRFRFEFIYWPTKETKKIAYGILTMDQRGLVAELPWHFAPSDFYGHSMWDGLQIEGSVPTHDDVLAAVVRSLVCHGSLPRELAAIFSDPDLLVHGFEKAMFPFFTLDQLRPIRISEERRDLAYTILRALADGCGKCGAVAHLHCQHGLSSSGAYRTATDLIETYPILFCRPNSARYHLTKWGHRILESLEPVTKEVAAW